MNTQWSIGDTEYQLFRYPPKQHDKTLQAWDSADELVVQHILADSELSNSTQPVIYDDQFGAICTALHNLKPIVVTDSYISVKAIHHNSEQNGLSTPTVLNALTPTPKSNLVIIKLTKNKAYLEHQLQSISQTQSNCRIIATGKTTLITTATLKLFEKYCINVSTSLAKKKSRLIFATARPSKGQDGLTHHNREFGCQWPERSLSLMAYANVFSKEQIDIGGRFLVEHLPSVDLSKPKTIIDLGCGNGLVGVSLLQDIMKSGNQTDVQRLKVIFCDESHMAIASSSNNIAANVSELSSCCEFIQDDCLSQQADGSADIILCNPPFHQQNTLTTHIAEQMFTQSYHVLKEKGQLLVVANRHLPYQAMLKSTFGRFKVLASNAKFVIYQATKRAL